MYLGKFKNMVPLMISVVIIIIGLLSFISMIDLNLTPSTKLLDEKSITIEEFDMMKKSDSTSAMADGFCESHKGDRTRLQDSCSELTKDNCMATSCCVYAKMKGKEQCHSGDEHGPTFRRDDNGKTHDIDYYYYKNKCFGENCPSDTK
jgi:hypothetical protein